ncbi:hypothetical protein C4K04_2040 [Pseudomonas chlororaphis]|jgi:hypothetical protein|uniref:DNA helicase n=1 Tax=Pseudomonas chlororaphis TaxID=587753 RepID=A0A3G7TKU2_9PSED|nr:AAA family ATPase [Pseudomonas chlororaphis]AZE47724.1 hypothetical protein C4K04_2040 [Pseudomonas chlororaphis]
MTKPSWYLPISEDLSAALSRGNSPDIALLSRYEIAAILYLHQLPRLPVRAPLEMERSFASLLPRDIELLKSALTSHFDRSAFTAGLMLAPELGISLMSQEAIASRKYVRHDGSWDFDYAKRQNIVVGALSHEHVRPNGRIIRVSDHQLRMIHTIRANQEDSIEAQAHAGTGKTFVIGEILELMPERRLMLLADTRPKLQPIENRFSKDQIKTNTFKDLAVEILARGNRELQNKMTAASRIQIPYSVLAEQVGLGPIGKRNAFQVAALCWGVLTKFCSSPDPYITRTHIPRNQIQWLSLIEQEAVAAAAAKLWMKMTCLDIESEALPVRGYHRIKQVALAGLSIPEYADTILVDEAQDLSGPVVQLLDESGHTVISLGDRFQNLQGHYVSHKATIRHNDMAISLRAGPALADFVNPLIAAFPAASALPFVADKSKETIVAEYPSDSFPPEPTVILVADEWGLFDWLIRNRKMKQGAAVVDWMKNFELFLNGCLGLYQHNDRPEHSAISQFRTWEDLRKVMSWNESFNRVEHWLETIGVKYGVTELYQHAPRSELSHDVPSRTLLATVFTAKNFEFKRMAISEDLYYFSDLRGKTALSKQLAFLYTAITRASGIIYFPDTHKDRLSLILNFDKNSSKRVLNE